jgi:hypothetical protein
MGVSGRMGENRHAVTYLCVSAVDQVRSDRREERVVAVVTGPFKGAVEDGLRVWADSDCSGGHSLDRQRRIRRS